MASTQQIRMFDTSYEQICEQRDMAAYRALGAITAAICFCKKGDTRAALDILTKARDRFDQIDHELQTLKTGDRNGNATANA